MPRQSGAAPTWSRPSWGAARAACAPRPAGTTCERCLWGRARWLRPEGAGAGGAACGLRRGSCTVQYCATLFDAWRCWRPSWLGRPGGERARSGEVRCRAPPPSASKRRLPPPAVLQLLWSTAGCTLLLQERPIWHSCLSCLTASLIGFCKPRQAALDTCAHIRPLARPRGRSSTCKPLLFLLFSLGRASKIIPRARRPPAGRGNPALRNTRSGETVTPALRRLGGARLGPSPLREASSYELQSERGGLGGPTWCAVDRHRA